MTQRVGIFSGTFDPFHIAHLEACLVSKAACDLDVIAVLVEKKPHRKDKVTAYETRLAMIDLALQEYPSVRLLESPGDNITIDNTLPILEEQFEGAEYWYIIGSDVVNHLKSWTNIGLLLKKLRLCVVLRSNQYADAVEKELKRLNHEYPELSYRILPEVWSPLSSSKIRSEISKNGYSEYVHREVMKYIARNNVY